MSIQLKQSQPTFGEPMGIIFDYQEITDLFGQ